MLKSLAALAVNKPVGDNSRRAAVKKRTQLKNPLTKTSTKCNKASGQFMAVRKSTKNLRVSARRSDGQLVLALAAISVVILIGLSVWVISL
jgi:hypothetical protein